MNLVWKLLRKHISVAQFAGFFLSNLLGMVIILLGIQLYQDIIPIFTQPDSFMKKDYLIVSKSVSTLGGILGKDNTFTAEDIKDFETQPFTKAVGAFTASRFEVYGGMEMSGQMAIRTELFFESVPDAFVDIEMSKWKYDPNNRIIPIVLPRNYLNLYNFGFAEARGLPKLSEGVMGAIRMQITLSGKGKQGDYFGQIVGFSNRLNTILVPQAFMNQTNEEYGEKQSAQPARLIVEVSNTADVKIEKYLKAKGYEIEGDKLNDGKTTYFLKVITTIVMAIGVVICLLSCFVLLLSIYLLLQKNSVKLQNLLLIGYSPKQVSMPYQVLTIGLNILIFFISLFIILPIRSKYLNFIQAIWANYQAGTIVMTVLIALIITVGISLLNAAIIRKKVESLWQNKP